MNNANQIQTHYQSIAALLADHRLKQALDELGSFVKEVPEWDLHSQFDELQTAYRYMLQYFRRNVSDPQRERLHADLLRKTYALNERLLMVQMELISSELFYATLREQKQDARSLADYRLVFETFAEDMAMTRLLHQGEQLTAELDKLRNSHEAAQNSLFNKVWTSPAWGTGMLEEARTFLASVLVPSNDLALFVSAVTMGLLQVFDARKLHCLFDVCEHTDIQVAQRALTGIVLACLAYEKRLTAEPELRASAAVFLP